MGYASFSKFAQFFYASVQDELKKRRFVVSAILWSFPYHGRALCNHSSPKQPRDARMNTEVPLLSSMHQTHCFSIFLKIEERRVIFGPPRQPRQANTLYSINSPRFCIFFILFQCFTKRCNTIWRGANNGWNSLQTKNILTEFSRCLGDVYILQTTTNTIGIELNTFLFNKKNPHH